MTKLGRPRSSFDRWFGTFVQYAAIALFGSIPLIAVLQFQWQAWSNQSNNMPLEFRDSPNVVNINLNF